MSDKIYIIGGFCPDSIKAWEEYVKLNRSRDKKAYKKWKKTDSYWHWNKKTAIRGFFKSKEEAIEAIEKHPLAICEYHYTHLVIEEYGWGVDNFDMWPEMEVWYEMKKVDGEYEDHYTKIERPKCFKGTIHFTV